MANAGRNKLAYETNNRPRNAAVRIGEMLAEGVN